MIDPDTARRIVLDHAAPLAPRLVPIDEAIGLRLAESVWADAEYPAFSRAMMDGYAVRVIDAGHTVRITGESAAGHGTHVTVTKGTAVAIMTGAPCPDGTEAVVPKERVVEGAEGVTLPHDIKSLANIMPAGSECDQGAEVLRELDVVTPLALGVLHTFGVQDVHVLPRPSVAVITTGDELVPSHRTPGPAQIRNSNGPMLAGALRMLGIEEVMSLHAMDDPHAFNAALDKASEYDIIVLTGAVSAGKYDTVPDALAAYGAETLFHKVSQQPGKPLLFAKRNAQLIFGLPGNPLSCHLGIHRYIAPAIRQYLGENPEPMTGEGELIAPVAAKDSRTLFQLVRVWPGEHAYRVEPIKGRSSADLFTGATANAILRVEPGQGAVPQGTQVRFEWLLK